MIDLKLQTNVDVEESVIGAMLLESSAVTEVAEIIKPEYFSDKTLAKLCEIIIDFYDKGKKIDLLTVSEAGRAYGREFQIRAVKCMQMVGSGANVVVHARIIQELYIKRRLALTGEELRYKAIDPSVELEELTEFISERSDEANELAVGGTFHRKVSETVKDSLSEMENRMVAYSEGRSVGITTGLRSLDKLTGGYQKQKLYVLAGRPAMGKTAVMLHQALSASKAGYNVVLFSLEMGDVSLTDRLVIAMSGVNANRYRDGSLTAKDLEQIEIASEKLSKLPITIDDTAGLTIRQIKARCALLKKRGECDLAMLDYLQLISSPNSNRNREQEVAQISRQCKIIAKDVDIPVVLLAQLSRAVETRENKRPRLSDLRESGAIEQDADVVTFIYRPAYYGMEYFDAGSLGEVNTKGLGLLDVAKQRDGGTGDVLFNHNDSMTKITDYERFEVSPTEAPF